jgi:beta-N-acetylhexosaminidase
MKQKESFMPYRLKQTGYLALSMLILISMLAGLLPSNVAQAAPMTQSSPEERARQLMSTLTPQEKVGQLVLVTFRGTDTNHDSQIRELINGYHIGGVVLRRSHDNFTGPENTLEDAWQLIADMQTIEWESSQSQSIDRQSGQPYSPNYIPLFVAISQEGDGYPYSQIINGLTQLPNQMTLGATWRPEYAEQVGAILGQELTALGFNLLLGPSLDILEDPSPDDTGDLGTRTFGGDPFWVGEFGKAFIRGVHAGSEQRMALVGKYFPGRGSSDRAPDEEVATIRKTLEQLKQIELAPFFAVTGDAPDVESTIDALMTSHIKYQGLQSNIRATTRPISFDPQAFNQLMSLPEFSVWRRDGGLMVSDELGSQAVRRFLDTSGGIFNARFVARDALLAGNDLLYLGNFTSSEDPDSFTSITKTLDFFAQKYREDAVFAQRVDDALLRILTLKFKLYPAFDPELVTPPVEHLESVGNASTVIFEIARQAVSLISPSPSELDSVLPNPPTLSDRIVFITDSYDVKQCSNCDDQPVIEIDTLENAVLRFYGPEAGGQTTRRSLLSFSFDHLQTMLDRGINRTEIEFHIKNAQWLVIAMIDVRSQRTTSQALKRFLAERPDLLRGKQVVVFAFNAPYFLDATDVSKLTAYYALYNKTPQAIEVAARLLFNEIRPLPGALPVSVQAVGYDLIAATAPDPTQVIPLLIDIPTQQAPPPGDDAPTATPTPPLEFQVGDLLPIRTGVILDHNGNTVPDNTPVQFVMTVSSEGTNIIKEAFATTTGGVARATFPIENQGNLAITAKSEPANTSTIININIAGVKPTETQTPTATPEATETPTPTPTEPAVVGEVIPVEPNGNQAALINWMIAIAAGIFISWSAYRVSILMGLVRWSIRTGLLTLIGGILLYIYTTLQLPGGEWLFEHTGLLAGSLAVLVGGLAGIGAAWIWRRIAA